MIITAELDITQVPAQLVTHLNFPNNLTAGIFATFMFASIFAIPWLLKGKPGIAFIIYNIFFIIAVGIQWLDAWIIIFQVLMISGLWSYGFLKRIWGG